ncbi:MAG: DUF4347 domain-containing protein [Lentisphaeria bacterium]|nr:DUF4347 domain-containing protein [Lentisphaeria bacterium]
MAKKMLRKQRIAIQKLEERVLFDAAGAAEIVDAAAEAEAAAQEQEAQEQEESAEEDEELPVEQVAPPEEAAVGNDDAENDAGSGEEAAAEAEGEEAEVLTDTTEFSGEVADAFAEADGEDFASDDISAADADDTDAADLIETESSEDEADAEADESVLAEEADADVSGEEAADDEIAFTDAFEADKIEVEQEESRELVILSDYIKDKETIISQLDENTDVLILEDDVNPLDQINEYLDSKEGVKYDAIHVVSHGNAGYFLLNDAIVDADAVAADPASWKAIGEHLTDDGDIMIYGCNVAASDDGKAMIANIAELTGADVAASVDKVGSANDWSLEYSYGIVDTQNVVINGADYSLESYTVVEAGAAVFGPGQTYEGFTIDGSGQLLDKENKLVSGVGTLEWVFGQLSSAEDDVVIVDSRYITGDDIVFTGDYTFGSLWGETEFVFNAFTANGIDVTFSGNLTVNSDLVFSGGVGNVTFTKDLTVTGSSFSLASGYGTISFGGDVIIGDLSDKALAGAVDFSTGSDAGFDFTETYGNTLSVGINSTFNLTVELEDEESTTDLYRVITVAEGGVWGLYGDLIMRVNDVGTGTVFELRDVYQGNTHVYGEVHGDATLIFANNLEETDLQGGGRIYMEDGVVRYELGGANGLNNDTLAARVYQGAYGTLGVFLGTEAQETFTVEDTYFDPEVRNVGVFQIISVDRDYDGEADYFSTGTINMDGAFNNAIFRGRHTTVDFEFGTTVDFVYDSNSYQDILGGNYYGLTIVGTEIRNLTNNLTVGTDSGKVDFALALKLGDYFGYDGFMKLGTVLNVNGYNVTFFGETQYGDSGEGEIRADGGTVTYNISGNHNSNVFYKGNYNNLTVQAVPSYFGTAYETFYNANVGWAQMAGYTLPEPDLYGDGTLTFDMNRDVDVKGRFVVVSLDADISSSKFESVYLEMGGLGSVSLGYQNAFDVTVSATVGNIGALLLQDANLSFTGNVLGNIGSITAVRSETFERTAAGGYLAGANANGTPQGLPDAPLALTFNTALARVGGLSVTGYDVFFNNDVVRIGTTAGNPAIVADVARVLNGPNSYHYVVSNVTFAKDVEIIGQITMNNAADLRSVLNFKGNTSGDARVDIMRGQVNYHSTVDQKVFTGNYDQLNILGAGTKTVEDDVTVYGDFFGSTSEIVLNGGTFQFSRFTASTGTEPNRPDFVVNSGATLLFEQSQTEGAIDFYGSITVNGTAANAGVVSFDASGRYHGIVTIGEYGSMAVNANDVVLSHVVNHGELSFTRPVTISLLHNYGETTIGHTQVKMDVYNHGTGNLIFNLVNKPANGAAFLYKFERGEGAAWNAGTTYNTGDEATLGSGWVAQQNGITGIEPGVEYWSELDDTVCPAYSNVQTYKAGDLVKVGGNYYVAAGDIAAGQEPGVSALWSQIQNYDAAESYVVGNYAVHNGELYSAVTDNGGAHAAVTPGETYWLTLAETATANRLINGGTITVSDGTLELSAFTQGDKSAANGQWHFDDISYVINRNAVTGRYGTLIVETASTALNSNNGLSAEQRSFLGDISNYGYFFLNTVADDTYTFAGSVTNHNGSEFVIQSADKVVFTGALEHNGLLYTTIEGADGPELRFSGAVSGDGTIAGPNGEGYNGQVTYDATSSAQRIINGVYNNTVKLEGNSKSVGGHVEFNDTVTLGTTIFETDGRDGEIFFNAATASSVGLSGRFDGGVDVVYTDDARTIFEGSYGNLEIISTTARNNVEVNLTVLEDLTLSGTISFGGNTATPPKLVVAGNMALLAGSVVTIGASRELRDATITGSGDLTITSTRLFNVSFDAEGYLGRVTYNAGEGEQNIIASTYVGGLTLTGGTKIIEKNLTVSGLFASSASDVIIRGGATVNAEQIQVDYITVKYGATLALNLVGNDNRLGNATPANGLVRMGGTLTVRGKVEGTEELRIYRWEDLARPDENGNDTITDASRIDVLAAGTLSIYSGRVYFDGMPETNGGIYASVMDLTEETGAWQGYEDPNTRLKNFWITISENVSTLDLTGYGINSKFLIKHGATLTVNGFDELNGNALIISDTIQAVRIEDGGVLRFLNSTFTAGGTGYTKDSWTVTNLIVEGGGTVLVGSTDSSAEAVTLNVTNAHLVGGENVIEALRGNGSVNFTGTTEGSGRVSMRVEEDSNSRVTYSAAVDTVYGGTYKNLTINGYDAPAEGEALAKVVTEDIRVDGNFEAAGKVTMTNSVTFNGTVTDAGNDTRLSLSGSVSGIGSFNFDAEESIVYYNSDTALQNVLQGTYSNLTLVAENYTVANPKVFSVIDVEAADETLTVTGKLSLPSQVIFGTADRAEAEQVSLNFNGANEGDGLVRFGANSLVTYNNAASRVFAGVYNDLTFSGTGGTAETPNTYSFAGNTRIDGELTLDTNAKITATGTVDHHITVTFAGSTQGAGALHFRDYTTAVYREGVTVISGTYYNLTLEGAEDDLGAVTVTGDAHFEKEVHGASDWIFAGTISGDGRIIHTGTVTYADGFYGPGFSGDYNNIVINAGNNSSKNPLGVTFSDVNIGGDVSGIGKVTFTKQVGLVYDDENDVNGHRGQINSEILTVVYDWGVGDSLPENCIMTGTYGTLILVGHGLNFTPGLSGQPYTHTDHGTYRLDGDVTVAVKMEIGRYAKLSSNNNNEFTLTINGSTNASLGDFELLEDEEDLWFEDYMPNNGVVDMGTGSTIVYGNSAEIFGGNYYNLTSSGDKDLQIRNITVDGLASFSNGVVRGAGRWVFNGTAATVSASFENVMTEYLWNNYYNNDDVQTPEYSIDSGFDWDTESYVDMEYQYYDDGAFDWDYVEPAYVNGFQYNQVVYGENFTGGGAALDGKYTNLVVNSAAGITFGNITLYGELSGTGNINFAGTNTFGVNEINGWRDDYSSSASANMSGDSTVVYTLANSKILGGVYQNLTLEHSHVLDSSFAVHKMATLNATQTLGTDVTISFLGTTNGAEGGRLEHHETQNTVIYGEDAAVFRGTYYNLSFDSGVIKDGMFGYDTAKGAYDATAIAVYGALDIVYTDTKELQGEYAFTMYGTAGSNLHSFKHEGGEVIYGHAFGNEDPLVGANVIAGEYHDITFKGGVDADHKIVYTAFDDVTINGHSTIERYAIFAAQGSSDIIVAGVTFHQTPGTSGYNRVWINESGSESLYYKDGRWVRISADGTIIDQTNGSFTDPFAAEWENDTSISGNMTTISFLGTTNAREVASVPGGPMIAGVAMSEYSTTKYAPGADMYEGSYYRFEVVGGTDVLFSDLPDTSRFEVTNELIVDIADGYYFVFDTSVSENFKLSVTIHGDIWYTNAYLGGDEVNPGHQPLGGSFAGSIRLGGDYTVDHSYSGTYDGDVLLSGVTITGDSKYIDAAALRGTLTIADSSYDGADFKLLVDSELTERPAVRYSGDSSIMALYTVDEATGNFVATAYDELILDGNLSVGRGNLVEVANKLTFMENATLTIEGDFILGSEAQKAVLEAAKPTTNMIAAQGTSEENVNFYLKGGSVLPYIVNQGNGHFDIVVENNASFSGIYVTGGTTNITAGNNATFNDILSSGGVLNLTAGKDAVFNYNIQVGSTPEGGAGIVNIHADSARLKGSGIYVEGGQLYLDLGTADSSVTSTIANDVKVSGAGALFTVAGFNVSFSGFVNVINSAEMRITGSNIAFSNDVLNYNVGTIGYNTTTGSGYKWIHDYLFNDAEYYEFYQNKPQSVIVPATAKNPGTITIDTTGKVTFSELVVSGGDFNIVNGDVYFNAQFAIADGTFSITGGNVFFKNDVYVSAVYGDGVASSEYTLLSITGGNVTMSGSLYNWVRIPVGYYGTSISPVLQYNGPFYLSDNKIVLRASLNVSEVYIAGDAHVTIVENVSNMGLWGTTGFVLAGNAEVTIGGNLANYSDDTMQFWSGTGVKYDYLTNLMGFSSGFGEAGTTHSLQPARYSTSAAAIFLVDEAARLQVTGETWNGATYTRGTAWGKTSGALGWSQFTVNSKYNQFTGFFTNSSHFYINGSENSFSDIETRYFMYINDTNSFGTITNYQDLKITNPGAVVLSLVNEGGKVWITGDADGFVFENELTVNGGFVSIETELGVPIASDVTITREGELTFSATNDIDGNVEITSGSLTFAGEAGNSNIRGEVSIGAAGTLNVSTKENSVNFFANIDNAGKFVVDGSITVDDAARITNSGSITIAKQSEIAGDLANETTGNIIVAAGAAGTVFNTVSNVGSFTNAANNVTYKGKFENKGTFINNNGITGVLFENEFVNDGLMKIDGEITVQGLFTNTASAEGTGLYVYGLADFNETVNTGSIYLEPITGKHAATVKFGDITNDGLITSLNDSRNAGDIYFKGLTLGNGTIEGFTGTLYYVYTGTEEIKQTFYENSKYGEVTVYVGNNSVNPDADYSKGLVTIDRDGLTFKALILDGGNLAIGDEDTHINVDASSFIEKTPGTITVNAGSTLSFSNEEGTEFTSSLHNYGLVTSVGDLVLMGTTEGNGLVYIGEGKSITYGYDGEGEQVLFAFAEGSATNLIIQGSDKAIATDMTIAKLTNNGSDINVRAGASLTLGEIDGTAAGVDGFTITTQAAVADDPETEADETRAAGILNVTAGTLNAAVENYGSFNVAAAGLAVALGGTVNNYGVLNASASAVEGENGVVNGSISFNGKVTNKAEGTFVLSGTEKDTIFFADLVNEGNIELGVGISWEKLANAGTITIVSDQIFNAGLSNTETGIIKIAENVTVTIAEAVTLDGTVEVSANAVLKVSVSGVLDDPNAEMPNITSGGARLNAVINNGLIDVTGEGADKRAVLSINTIDNANGRINVGGFGDLLVTDKEIDVIQGEVELDADGRIYTYGKLEHVSIVVTTSKKLSEMGNGIYPADQDKYNHIGFTAKGEEVVFTIDVDSGDVYSFKAIDGAELAFTGNDLQIDGIVSVAEDASITVSEGSSVTFTDTVTVDSTLENKGTVTIDSADSSINALDNSGTLTTAGNIGDVIANSGSITADGNIGDVAANSGSITADGNIGNVADNSGSITADGNIGDVAFNSGSITADGSVGNVGGNVEGGQITASVIGDVTDNAGTITAGTVDPATGEFITDPETGMIVADGTIGNIGSNAGNIAAGTIGNVTDNSGTLTQNGDNGSIGDITVNSGTITVNGDDTVMGNISSNEGQITVNGDGVTAGSVINGEEGTLSVNGGLAVDTLENYGKTEIAEDASLGALVISNTGVIDNKGLLGTENEDGTVDPIDVVSNTGTLNNDGEFHTDVLNNAGTLTNNGSLAAEVVDNSGSFTDNGEVAISIFNNSGDAELNGSGKVGTLINSGNVSVGGSGYSITSATNSGSFDLGGSGNSISQMNNTGTLNFNSGNNIGSLNNYGAGFVSKDGVIWMMATDEGMSPEFFSDGKNLNFSVLSLLTARDLDAMSLDDSFSSKLFRLAPGRYGTLADSGARVVDLGFLGGDTDMIDIDAAVDEMLHGSAPAIDDEEIMDVLAESSGFEDDFDTALDEIIND